MKRFTVHAHGSYFLYSVDEDPENKEDRLFLGKPQDPEGPCVTFTIPHIGKDASLDHAMYDAKCTEEGPMQKGAGTVLMLHTACSLVFHRYSHIQRIVFNDVSEILPEGIPLYHLSMLKHGKTWYQQHLGATPRTSTRQALTQWHTVLAKPIRECMTFATFQKRVVRDSSPSLNMASLKEQFQSGATTQHIFAALEKPITRGLIERFVFVARLPTLLYSEWCIRRNALDPVPYQIKKDGNHSHLQSHGIRNPKLKRGGAQTFTIADALHTPWNRI